VYGAVIRREASALEARFGERYVSWARAVPIFVPRLAPHRGPESGARFTFERWRRNREYEAVLGVLAGFLFLAAKLLL
jgi:hypothetical protein